MIGKVSRRRSSSFAPELIVVFFVLLCFVSTQGIWFYDLSWREFYDWECLFGKTTIILKECSTRGLAAFGICQEILFGFCNSSRLIDRVAMFQHPPQTCTKEPDAKRDKIAAFCRCPVSLKNQSEGVCLFSVIFFVPCTIVSIFCAQPYTLLEFCCLPSL